MNQLQKFQQEKGLVPDGIMGPNTLRKMIQVFGLQSNAHAAHFIGQMAHESGNFTREVEGLNYSAKGLRQYFRNYFTAAQALEYARQPQRIANRAYANRLGNGDEASGDGWKYRGRGPLQLSLKNNYIEFGKYVNDLCVVSHPNLINDKYYFQSALFYFTRNRLWQHCKEVNVEQILKVSRAVNLGNAYSRHTPNHLEDRVNQTNKFYTMLCR